MKKILLIIAIALCIFQMVVLATAIEIGAPAINRGTTAGDDYTWINSEYPSNGTGKITSVEIYAYQTLLNCEVATFVKDGSLWSTRAIVAIGTVTGGAKRTFPVDLDVEVDDCIGIFFTGGSLERDTAGHLGVQRKGGDFIPCTDVDSWSSYAGDALSLYGTGTTGEEEANAIFFGTNF